jgi:hypothetical protein
MIVGSTKDVAIVSGLMIHDANEDPAVIAVWLRNAYPPQSIARAGLLDLGERLRRYDTVVLASNGFTAL